MGAISDDFEAQNDDADAPKWTFAEHLGDALNDICEAWKNNIEGNELAAKMRRIACRWTRSERLPPVSILAVLRDSEHAPRGHELLAAWHVRPLPIDRIHERMTLKTACRMNRGRACSPPSCARETRC